MLLPVEKNIQIKDKISADKHIKAEPFRKDTRPEGYVLILKNSFLQESRDESLKQLLHLVWHANSLYLGEVTLFPIQPE